MKFNISFMLVQVYPSFVIIWKFIKRKK